MISTEFEAELVKKVQGQQADLSRHGAADRQLAHEICFSIDDKMLPYLLGVDPSSGCAILRVLHKEILASTAEHSTALHERFEARPLQGQDEAVVDVETVAYRPQGVAGGRKLAIQRDSDAILEDGDGLNQRLQQRPRNHRFACAE